MAHQVHPEALLISAVIQTGEYQVLAAQNVTVPMFHVYDHEYAWLSAYITRTGKVPSKTALRQQYPDFTIYKVDDTKHWCEEVRASHKRQALVDMLDQAVNSLDAGDIDRALADIQDEALNIEMSSQGLNPDFNVFDDWQEVYANVSERVDRVRLKGYAGIPTGFTTLDNITGGLQGGWLVILAARLGQGKTWTGVRMAWEAAIHDCKVAYFSLEQSRFQIAMRVHAFGSRQFAKQAFDPLALNRGSGFDIRDYKAFLTDMQQKRGKGDFYINDTSRGMVTPSSIASVIQTRQPDIVFIDYLTLLGAASDDWRGTAKLSSELQSIGQRFNVPIVALSQVNRLGIGKEPPGAEHLSQADAIGQDADLVVTMAQRSKSVMQMRAAKFRHGPSGEKWMTRFSPSTGEFEEITYADAEEQIEKDQEVD